MRAGFVEGVSGVLAERLGYAGGNEGLRMRLRYISKGRGRWVNGSCRYEDETRDSEDVKMRRLSSLMVGD